jgi:hypothetical protein
MAINLAPNRNHLNAHQLLLQEIGILNYRRNIIGIFAIFRINWSNLSQMMGRGFRFCNWHLVPGRKKSGSERFTRYDHDQIPANQPTPTNSD